MSDENPTPEEKAAAEAKAAALKVAKEKATETNKARTGKGTRVEVGSTRGRSTQVISFEQWDESKPDTLPTTLSEFMDLRRITEEKDIIKRLIIGDNSLLYSDASDPIAEFVDPTWSDDVQSRFRIVVRNYAVNAQVSIEDAVALIKPGIVAAQAKSAAK